MKKVFVAALTARHKDGMTMNRAWASSDPQSEAEALGLAMANAMERWPQADGFYNHRVDVMDISRLFDEVCEAGGLREHADWMITDEQARAIGQEIGQAIGAAMVGIVKSVAFYHRKSDGIKVLTELLGQAMGKAMKE